VLGNAAPSSHPRAKSISVSSREYTRGAAMAREGRGEADRPSRFSVGSSPPFRDSSRNVELDSQRANPRWISGEHRWSIVEMLGEKQSSLNTRCVAN